MSLDSSDDKTGSILEVAAQVTATIINILLLNCDKHCLS